ncbi:MAG: Ig-like domain-containing protein, partial [Psychrosphaera sp.]|nr:Ig-like domain-containing protein [Psychrosphaera sp.]
PLTVVNAPVITAEFIDDPVTAGQDVTLRYTITNSDAVNTVSKITFTENINEAIGGIVIKTRPDANSCGTGSTFTSNDYGSGLLYFGVADANLVGGANCTFDVILTLPADATPGTWGYSTTAPSAVVNGATVYGTAVSHNLIVVSAPTLFLSITEAYASPGATVTAQFTLNYSPLATADVTGVGFTVDLENALTGLVSTTATQNDVCGSGSTFGGTSTLTLSGASMSADSTCTFSVTLQIPADAVPSTISVLSSTVTGTSGGQSVSAASASDAVVISGLSWGIAVVTDPTAAGATNILRFTINNAATGLAATAISTTMDLNKALSGLKGTSSLTDPCGTGSQLSGTTYLSFSGASLQPGTSCTFDVNILVPANASPGGYNLTTNGMSATVNGNNTATPIVTTVMNVESLTVNVATTATSPYTTTPIPVNIDFSRSVTGFPVAALPVTNGTASNFAGSGLLYTADITPTASGTVTISVPASVANDAVFNSVTNPASNTLSFTYEATPISPTPTIAISAPSTSQANTGPVTYTVTYTNAAEIGLSPSAITLNKTQSATATVTVTTVDSLTRTITLSSITGDGTLGVSLNEGTARNGDQQAPAIGPSNTFSVDNASPTVAISG